MAKDFKSYIKQGKTQSKSSNMDQFSAEQRLQGENLMNSYSQKSQQEREEQLQMAVQSAKRNGTFDKGELQEMLQKIKMNLPSGQFEQVKNMIEKL